MFSELDAGLRYRYIQCGCASTICSTLYCVQLWFFDEIWQVNLSAGLECSKELCLSSKVVIDSFCGKFTKCPTPGITYLLLNGLYVHLGSSQFPPTCGYHLWNIYAYLVIFIIIVVHRCYTRGRK